MLRASIVVPTYNASATLAETLRSLLAQDMSDFEIIVVDDGSSDSSGKIALSLGDPRIRVVRQLNRGLAGARNTGIAHATGNYVGFCDADDLWVPEKLSAHVALLDANPDVGLSYSGSRLIDGESRLLNIVQRPKTDDISARDILYRNPIGNGSSAVMRRSALDAVAFRPQTEQDRDWWFDETFRQSEDIEFWTRFALTSGWRTAGIADPLTLYRIVDGGLSANLHRQLETWERVAARVTEINPVFAARTVPAARAYQLRYLARRAVSLGDGRTALKLLSRGAKSSMHPVVFEPAKTLATAAAAIVAAAGGGELVRRSIGMKQAKPE